MHYNHLPIYKSALDLCVTVEIVVKEFDKYVKYTIGSDLRAYAKRILFGIHKANRSYDKSILLEWNVNFNNGNSNNNNKTNDNYVRCVRGGE